MAFKPKLEKAGKLKSFHGNTTKASSGNGRSRTGRNVKKPDVGSK